MNNPREHLHCSRRGCSYTTNRAYNLERHERNHDKGKVPISQCQPCPHCTYAAGSLHNLMRHISKKHAGVAVKTQQQVVTSQQPEPQAELSTSSKSISNLETNPAPTLQPTVQQSPEPPTDPSLWFWTSIHQQEKNFIRRSGLKGECMILDRSVNLFKLYALVRARGGALDVDEWDDVASALSLPPGSGCNVGVKYMEVLFEFEKKEEERLQECHTVPGLPPWWDDGDFITDEANCSSGNIDLSSQWWNNINRPPLTVQNAIIKMIYDKYYSNHFTNSKPFQRFCVKDSWLRATMMNYQELRCQLHGLHCTAS